MNRSADQSRIGSATAELVSRRVLKGVMAFCLTFATAASPARSAKNPIAPAKGVAASTSMRKQEKIAAPTPQRGSSPQTERNPESADAQLAAIRNREVLPIDLTTALALVGLRNPEVLLAQQRVAEAVALRQLAAVQYLPTLNLGTSFDNHTGNLQQSSGNILSVNRNSLYVGAGAYAIAAGTVNIPGVVWNLNVSDAIFAALGSRQIVSQRQFDSQAVRNDIGLQVATAYLDLLEAEGQRSILLSIRIDAAEVARLTYNYARTGQGNDADAQRAATELRDREAQVIDAEAATVRASARLSRLLRLDPNIQLHPTDNWVVPHALVPGEIPLAELVTTAILRRPEMLSRRAAIREALLAAQAARLLPFSPSVFIGISAGAEGGGSNLINQPVGTTTFARGLPYFGSFDQRTDFDAMAYWTLRNIGIGNRALIQMTGSQLRASDLRFLAVMDQVRAEVADAYVRCHTRFEQIKTAEFAIQNADLSWTEDLRRIRAAEGLPIEVLDSLHLLADARRDYLDAIMSFNRAQFELYVALGQPPANMLARPVAEVVPPPSPTTDSNQGPDKKNNTDHARLPGSTPSAT